MIKIVFGKSQSNNKRWRAMRAPASLLFWLHPLFLGLYWKAS